MNRERHPRWHLLVAMLAALAMLAAACGSSADDATAPVETEEATDVDTDDPDEDDEPAEVEDTDEAEEPVVEEATDEERTLTIYAPWEGARVDWITEAASADLGINVEFLSIDGGDLADRLLAERNNTQADIALGVGEAQINVIAAEGIFQPYEPEWSDKVPSAFIDDENLFTLFAQVPIVMSYNPAVIDPADAPTSWTDLADPAFAGQFVLPGLGGQTGQSAIAGILWRFADPVTGEVSDEGWQVLADIYANEFQIGEGEDFNPEWIADGTQPIFINWRGGVANIDNDNDAFELTIIDTEGGTPFVSTGVAITAATDSPGVAQEFVDWFGSADTQIRFVTDAGNDPPANVDAVPELETAALWLDGVSLQEIDWGVVSTVSSEWFERVELDLIN